MHSPRHPARGSVTLWWALTLPVLMGFGALALDIARIQLAKQELQNAADAAALAGAAVLNQAGGDIPYNWTAARQSATAFIPKNPVSGRLLSEGDVSVGYVRSGDPTATVVAATSAGAGLTDVPAVKVVLPLAVGRNGGPLPLLLAPVLGLSSHTLQAEAVASAYPPGRAEPGALFPVVLAKCLFDLYWDYAQRRPKINPLTGQPYDIIVGSVYQTTCLSGEWTTFKTVLNSTPAVRSLIDGGNPEAMAVGDPTYIQSGVKDTIYADVPVNKTVVVSVVNTVVTGSSQTIIAMAAFRITSVIKVGGKSFILGRFMYGVKSVGLSSGTGGGMDLGVATGLPSLLIR